MSQSSEEQPVQLDHPGSGSQEVIPCLQVKLGRHEKGRRVHLGAGELHSLRGRVSNMCERIVCSANSCALLASAWELRHVQIIPQEVPGKNTQPHQVLPGHDGEQAVFHKPENLAQQMRLFLVSGQGFLWPFDTKVGASMEAKLFQRIPMPPPTPPHMIVEESILDFARDMLSV